MCVLSSGRQKEPSAACVILRIMWLEEFVSSAKTDSRMSLLLTSAMNYLFDK